MMEAGVSGGRSGVSGRCRHAFHPPDAVHWGHQDLRGARRRGHVQPCWPVVALLLPVSQPDARRSGVITRAGSQQRCGAAAAGDALSISAASPPWGWPSFGRGGSRRDVGAAGSRTAAAPPALPPLPDVAGVAAWEELATGAGVDAWGAGPGEAPAPLVGVFDSGLGGLSIVTELQLLAPGVRVLYVADTLCFPYGDKSPELVAARTLAVGRALAARGCQALVVACNTASSVGLSPLRAAVGGAVPVVGVEPPLKPAVLLSAHGAVAILATAGTVSGPKLAGLLTAHAAGRARVWALPMPGLAGAVERGDVRGAAVEGMLRAALAAPLAEGADVVALGCTHYYFLKDALTAVLPQAPLLPGGPLVGGGRAHWAGVRVACSAAPVARHALHLLAAATGVKGAAAAIGHRHNGAAESAAGTAPVPPAEVRVYTTSDPTPLATSLSRLAAAGAHLPLRLTVRGTLHLPVTT